MVIYEKMELILVEGHVLYESKKKESSQFVNCLIILISQKSFLDSTWTVCIMGMSIIKSRVRAELE